MQAHGMAVRARATAAAAAAVATARRCRVSAAAVAAPAARARVTHSMPPEKAEVFRSLEGWAARSLLPLLKPVDDCWQPADFLPDSSSEMFEHEVRELRARAAGLPDEYFVVLVGDMVTEEALPTYQTMINTLDGVRDETGASACPWAVWTRAWTAEENRHGDILAKYMYLSGRVDMRMVEKTVQYLIGSGMVRDRRRHLWLPCLDLAMPIIATFVLDFRTRGRRTTHTWASCTRASRSARRPSRTATLRGSPRRTATTSWRAPAAPSPPTRSGTRRPTGASWSSCCSSTRTAPCSPSRT